MGLVKEFKEFAVKGSVVDMAIGIIIGTAFSGIVNSLVQDIIMPPLSVITGEISIDEMNVVLEPAKTDSAGNVIAEAITLNYGKFVEVSLDFLLIALAIFLFIRAINTLRKKAEDPQNETVTTPKDISLLTDIKGILKDYTSRSNPHSE